MDSPRRSSGVCIFTDWAFGCAHGNFRSTDSRTERWSRCCRRRRYWPRFRQGHGPSDRRLRAYSVGAAGGDEPLGSIPPHGGASRAGTVMLAASRAPPAGEAHCPGHRDSMPLVRRLAVSMSAGDPPAPVQLGEGHGPGKRPGKIDAEPSHRHRRQLVMPARRAATCNRRPCCRCFSSFRSSASKTARELRFEPASSRVRRTAQSPSRPARPEDVSPAEALRARPRRAGGRAAFNQGRRGLHFRDKPACTQGGSRDLGSGQKPASTRRKELIFRKIAVD